MYMLARIMLWPVLLLLLICTTSNASSSLQTAVPHQVLPFEISVRHAATVVNEMSKAIANTSQSINSNTSIVCTLFSHQKDIQTEEKQHANRVCNQSTEGCLRGTDLLFSNQAIKILTSNITSTLFILCRP